MNPNNYNPGYPNYYQQSASNFYPYPPPGYQYPPPLPYSYAPYPYPIPPAYQQNTLHPPSRIPSIPQSNYQLQPRRASFKHDGRHSRRRSRSRSRSRSRCRTRSRNRSRSRSRGSYRSSYRRHDSRHRERHGNQHRDLNFTNTEPSFTQTTLVPTYYIKDDKNPKLTKASQSLIHLCNQFEEKILNRSRLARQKADIPAEKLAIPDYRQLLMTKKFQKFSRCTCDKASHHECINESDESSTESPSSESESESEDKKTVPKEPKEDKFEDLRSMEINRKQNHPERLHPELSFNEPNQTNDGPLCKCKLKNTKFGTRHQIYYGEKAIESCDLQSNNFDRLYHYRMSVSPYSHFISKHPTKVAFDGHDYVFEGYSIFSHEPIDHLPDCVVVIYNTEFKLNLVKEDMLENFTMKELDLLKSFIFTEILELYDLKWKGFEVNESACDRFHVMPRFCRQLPYNGKEILSPCEILKYFMENSVPVIDDASLAKCHTMSEREWLSFIEPLQGSIITCPGKRPASIRLDQLDRDQVVKSCKKSAAHPLIIHFSMFRSTWLPLIKNNQKLKKLYHKYFKLKHLLNNKSKPSLEDKANLRSVGDQLEQLIRKSTQVQKETVVELSAQNFTRTGIRTDLVEFTLLIPSFVEHLRFHLSLRFLETKIGYTFKNRSLLQHALTHPSGAFLLHQNLGSNPDHIRNCLFNCKARTQNHGTLTSHKRKSLLRKKGIHMLFSIMSQKESESEQASPVGNYERLEFLGDKILELLTSHHLFFMFPQFDEGKLSEYRNVLVQNQYLAILARKLDLHFFIIFYHGVDLCSNSALNHALANSFEALLAAIYLDSDLDTVSQMLSKVLWDEADLFETWSNLRPHPIQAQLPSGDRHLIANTKILQHVSHYEKLIGLEFNHIRLLAQAFCTRSASFNLITLGDNQRLEFLGDTVLNFVVSDYLYRHFPTHHEGHLSLLRSSLVCNSTQALLYDELAMSDFVLAPSAKPENSGNLKRKADVFEAFVGALYVDQELEVVKVFCNVCMFNKLKDIILYQFWHDPKSRLQQCCLSIRDVDEAKPSLPVYKLIEEKGPPNHKQYKVAVYFNRRRIGEGIGKSIHDAEIEAAKHALKTNKDMFPILDKYIAAEIKKSKYIVDFENDECAGTHKKKNRKNRKNKKAKTSEAN